MCPDIVRNMFAFCAVAGCFSVGGCTVDTEQQKQNLMATDRAFSQLSDEQGRAAAFNAFMTDEAVLYRNGVLPFEGRDAIVAIMASDTGGTLLWEPTFADVSASGDMGYTLGQWSFTAKDQQGQERTSRGRYVTFWKKQADGTWKFVFDSGIQTQGE